MSGCLLCGTLWDALDLKLVASRGQRGRIIFPLQGDISYYYLTYFLAIEQQDRQMIQLSLRHRTEMPAFVCFRIFTAVPMGEHWPFDR